MFKCELRTYLGTNCFTASVVEGNHNMKVYSLKLIVMIFSHELMTHDGPAEVR